MKSGILYQGPSLIDGQLIVVIATTASKNTKTGAMVQTWILRQDIAPHAAIHTGDDYSICGNCPKRGTIENGRNIGRECYVTTFQAPLSVYKKFRRGGYEHVNPSDMGADRKVRIGSYGDPMAAPASVWEALTGRSDGWTGYTHQWNTDRPDADAYKPYCMASADSPDDKRKANAKGWRTFRVMAPGARRMAGEISCPASAEAGHKTTCATCRMCQGTSTKSRREPVIEVHGIARNRYKIAA
jgi:hypothetical protein